jgi:hypothetical protein
VTVQVHDPRLPGGMLEVDTNDPKVAAAAAKKYLAAQSAKQPKQQAAPSGPSVGDQIWDAARSIPGGLAKGAAAVAGLPGDLGQLGDRALDYVTGAHVADFKDPTRVQSSDVNRALSAPTGGYYQPKTTAGNYAETIASFAPAAVGGEASIASRLLTRVAAPAVASEAAGQATAGTEFEPYARAGAAIVTGGLPTAARMGTRLLNRGAAAAGVPFLDPANEAQARLSRAIQSDGGMQPIIRSLSTHGSVGASQPALVDVAGNNVKRLVRAAAGGEGEGQNIALDYANTVRGNYQEQLLRHTRGLNPGTPGSAGQHAELLANRQDNLAQHDYREGPNAPYNQPAVVTREMVSALQGPAGRRAINEAYATASARRDAQQMAELSDLRNVAAEQSGGADPLTGRRRTLDQALSELSAGSLDRVRIAMRETGRSLAANGNKARAGGYFDRVRDIDTALDQTPGLTEARRTYKGLGAQMDAVDVGQGAYTAPSDEYSAEIARLSGISPAARTSAGVGHRQALKDAIERGPEGATGAANKIATSTQQTQNLRTSFGEPAATRYQTAVDLETQRLRNANMISPNTGSQTQLRGADEAMLSSIPLSKHAFVAAVIDRLRHGLRPTAAERAEIVRIGTSPVQLQRIAQTIPANRMNALLAGTHAQIGANHPNN